MKSLCLHVCVHACMHLRACMLACVCSWHIDTHRQSPPAESGQTCHVHMTACREMRVRGREQASFLFFCCLIRHCVAESEKEREKGEYDHLTTADDSREAVCSSSCCGVGLAGTVHAQQGEHAVFIGSAPISTGACSTHCYPDRWRSWHSRLSGYFGTAVKSRCQLACAAATMPARAKQVAGSLLQKYVSDEWGQRTCLQTLLLLCMYLQILFLAVLFSFCPALHAFCA